MHFFCILDEVYKSMWKEFTYSSQRNVYKFLEAIRQSLLIKNACVPFGFGPANEFESSDKLSKSTKTVSISDYCRAWPTLLWVTTTYKLQKTVANEDSASKRRNSARHKTHLAKWVLRCPAAMLIWQGSTEVVWRDGLA